MSAKRIGPEELTARFQDALKATRDAVDSGCRSAEFLKGLEYGFEIFFDFRDEERNIVDFKPPAAEP